MRTRFITLAMSMLMIASACGSEESTDTSADPLPTVSSAATTTDSSSATVATTTTSQAPAASSTTTTAAEPEPDPYLEGALAAAGVYSGSWTNTTFGSTGDAGLTMIVTAGGDVSMEWDLGGFVFGAADPDGETQTLNVSQLVGGMTLSTGVFGDVEITVGEDFATITFDADDVPTPGIQTFNATATWSDDGTITGTYVVEFDGGGEPAVGTFEMTRS